MSWFSRLKAVFRPAQLDHDIAAEQSFHLAARVDQLVAEGLDPGEAARQANILFGGRVRLREECREARLLGWLESAKQDSLYGLRMLRKSPSFSAVAILTLALGIGANTAIFSVVNGVLLNPLPYPNGDRLVSLFEQVGAFNNWSISYPNFLDWQRMNRTFSALAAYRSTSVILSDRSMSEHLYGEMISAGLFETLGVRPILGRTFSNAEDRRGTEAVAMISESLWRRKFGGTPGIIGLRLLVDGTSRTVVGIVPAAFHLQVQNFERGAPPVEVYLPIGSWNEPLFHDKRDSGWGMDAIGLLKPGITFGEAKDDMERVSAQLSKDYPDVNANAKASLIPLKEEMIGNTRPVLLILLGAVGFVLLICCVNVANLLLARSTARTREFAIRLAIGAGRKRLLRQLLTESVLLSLAGGALGLLLASLGTSAALALTPLDVPRSSEVHLDGRVLLFAAGWSLVTGLLFGLVPAMKMQGTSLGGVLKETARSLTGTRRDVQHILVISEIALAVVLLAGAGLMVRTLSVLWRTDPGFHSHNLLNFAIAATPPVQQQSPGEIQALFQAMHDKIASVPGVDSASLSWGAAPLAGDSEGYFWIAGRPKPAHMREYPMAINYVVDPSFCKTFQIALKRGRFISQIDNGHSEHVAVIDEAMSRQYFPKQDPVGRYLDFNVGGDTPGLTITRIVGVVAHVNQWGLDSDATSSIRAQIYFPITQIPERYLGHLAGNTDAYIRVRSGGSVTLGTLRAAVAALNPGLTAYDLESMDSLLGRSIAVKRFIMTLLVLFAGLAVLLASVGVYGVLSYLVGLRTREIGIRMALGANRIDVMRMIMGDGFRMAGTGVVAGTVAALALTRLLSGMLFGVKPFDPPTFVTVAGVLCAVALLSSYLPARRALQIGPTVALREE